MITRTPGRRPDFSAGLVTAVVRDAARDAKRRIRIVESRSQAWDHPVHPAMPETRYLKCLILAVE